MIIIRIEGELNLKNEIELYNTLAIHHEKRHLRIYFAGNVSNTNLEILKKTEELKVIVIHKEKKKW